MVVALLLAHAVTTAAPRMEPAEPSLCAKQKSRCYIHALYRMEGKEYVVADGDVLLFEFNV
jgi:ribosome-binding ATPase YchF (GTP1/OBG family)